MIGIVTTQLFNLEQEQDTRISFGYYALSKPLGALFQIAAILVITIGTHRWWRQQMSMARGKVWAGGWEVYTIMGTVFAVRPANQYTLISHLLTFSQAHGSRLLSPHRNRHPGEQGRYIDEMQFAPAPPQMTASDVLGELFRAHGQSTNLSHAVTRVVYISVSITMQQCLRWDLLYGVAITRALHAAPASRN